MNLYICGDLHGSAHVIEDFYKNNIKHSPREAEENWIILLGDSGCNYYMNYKDHYFKQRLCSLPFNYFVIRGNHEERASICAENSPTKWETVDLFGGKCLHQPEYPNIYYASDAGGIYYINGRKTLVVPGAYSVDKYYRLARGWSWFSNEQLSPQEMAALESMAAGQYFDLVLSHTCPYTYRPTDLFLGCIDQSSVDSSMELWMDQLNEKIVYHVWCWGHYHADRVEAPYCEMFYQEIEDLEDIETRWGRYNETGELDWWLPKAPNFHMYSKYGN